MNILFVNGGEFAASMFEEKYSNISKAYKDVVENGGRIETEDFTVKLMEFGPVDQSFVNLIINTMLDYDDTKHTNFYVVEN